jgi:hypothetical protein
MAVVEAGCSVADSTVTFYSKPVFTLGPDRLFVITSQLYLILIHQHAICEHRSNSPNICK